MKKIIKKLVTSKSENLIGAILGVLVVAVLCLLVCGISWIATCGIIYLICLCFGWTFSWAVATGIWLVILLLKSIFGKSGGKD